MKKSILVFCLIAALASCKSESDKNAELAKSNVEYYSRVWDVVINEGRSNILDAFFGILILLSIHTHFYFNENII